MTRAAIVAALTFLAVVVRLAAIVYTDAAHAVANENRVIAVLLNEGQGFSFNEFQAIGPTSLRAPVYPILLAAMEKLPGSDPHWAVVGALGVNVLFAAMAVPLAFLLGKRIAGDRVGYAFATLLAVWPTQVYAAAFPQGLTIGVALSLATLFLIYRVRAPQLRPRTRSAVLAGGLAGLAVLTEAALVLPLLISAGALLRRRPKVLGVVVGAALLLVLPWVYRNTLVHGRPTGITDTFGRDLFLGNGDGATGSYHQRQLSYLGKPQLRIEQLSPQENDSLRRRPEAERHQWMAGRAYAWVARHPIDYLRLCGVRLAKTFWLDWHHPDAFRLVNVASRTVAAIALLAALATGRRWTLPLLWCVGVLLTSVLTVAEARSAVFMDVSQLLALALFADRSRKA
jgi:hypothetical protein